LNQRNTVSPAAVHAAKSATEAIPILADDLESDPISSGFVASLAHPGRNIPDVFSDFPDFSMKWLQLLKEIIPALSRVRVLWDPATGSIQLDAVQSSRPIAECQTRHNGNSRDYRIGAGVCG
jgi:putative tryptophan/tyrosine transport system substrate-binding protein